MQHLDVQVAEQALSWLQAGDTIWYCTVLSTFGSSPREPGSVMVAKADGQHLGSLSGGCVEEDFLSRLQQGEFSERVRCERYGDARDPQRPQISLPCGGILEVLIERLEPTPSHQRHLCELVSILKGQQPMLRQISLQDGHCQFSPVTDNGGDRVQVSRAQVSVRIGPARRLILAGLSSVSRICAGFAVTLGYEVIVCEPREEEYQSFDLPGVRLETLMPSAYISKDGNCHAQTAVIAATHDPRIDDLAMIEAVKTGAFYIGVMGSRKTSDNRAARLMRSGGLSPEQVERIHMPIGLALGSKTPAEIALAIMADVLRVQRGIDRHDL
ncbi:MAG: XshC-Cox1 family protein [Oceanospirillaceae bacterium]|nr:XshC-Cox1 family protein [Oceanospirillaceae bacterium]|tara:strand:- start:32534 stop:33514 length:981 start_codon:yes stop_codon:yes gene_type:complete